MKKILEYFFKGLLISAPIGGSLFIVYTVFTKLDDLFPLPIPGLGFLLTVSSITLIGLLGSNFLTKTAFDFIEKQFSRLPLIKILYTSIKDMLNAFFGENKGFDTPVLVTLNQVDNIQVMGFITNRDLNFLGLNNHVAVYLPQSYNFAGNTILVPANAVTQVHIDRSKAITFIVSGGITTPPKKGSS
ncbi:MAG: DUF502 domain-containing protein [Candidatus Margulisiibacteriota bacterium]